MSDRTHPQVPLEPERYELTAAAPYRFDLDRREFFKFLGAGVLVVSVLKPAVAAQESGGARQGRRDLPKEIDAWLHIGERGKVTVYTGKAEMGQNIRTSLSQAVAEELHVPIGNIELVMGDTQLTPFDMGTFGSRTTPTMNPQLRKVAAAAREMLIGLAAAQWQTDRSRLVASDGKVTDPGNKRSVEYAALTKGQQLTQTVTAETPLIPAASWKVAGQSALKVDGRDFVTGKHRYPSDQKLPDMLYGKVLRPPSFGATLLSVDAQKAEQMGATVVHDGNFVGVAAASTELAAGAVAAIHAEWKSEPQPSSKELFDYLRKNTVAGDDPTGDGDRYDVGAVDQALGAADHRVQQTYTVSYIAHVPLEPRAALAKWDGDKLTVWTGTQRPFGVRDQLAEAFRIPEDRVRVLMPDTGSGYGGKHTGETAIEAARLARAAKRPVKVVWTREEEFSWAYFRPAGVIDVTGGVRSDGTITAWEFHNYNSGSAGIRTLLRDSEPAHCLPCDAFTFATGIVPGAGRDCQPFRPRVAHGRTGARGEDGSAGIPTEEPEGREAARGVRGGGETVRLGEKQGCGSGIWHGRRVRKIGEHRYIRRGPTSIESRERSRSFGWFPPLNAARS